MFRDKKKHPIDQNRLPDQAKYLLS